MYHQYNNNMIITTWTHTQKKTENILKEKKKERKNKNHLDRGSFHCNPSYLGG
jgi:hypothetical protein